MANVNYSELLDKMIALQKIDTAIQEIELKNNEAKAKISEFNRKIEADKLDFSKKKSSLDEIRKKKSQIELEIKAKDDDMRKKSDQLFQVKTNEAYKTLQDEINKDKEAKDRLETEELKVMEDEDSIHRSLKEQEQVLKKGEETIRTEIKKFEDEIKSRDGIISGEKTKRDEAAKLVDRNWYDRYERIRQNKNGLALAALTVDDRGDGICGGCKFRVRPQAVIEVKKKTEIHTCENCARIWYFEEKEGAVK